MIRVTFFALTHSHFGVVSGVCRSVIRRYKGFCVLWCDASRFPHGFFASLYCFFREKEEKNGKRKTPRRCGKVRFLRRLFRALQFNRHKLEEILFNTRLMGYITFFSLTYFMNIETDGWVHGNVRAWRGNCLLGEMSHLRLIAVCANLAISVQHVMDASHGRRMLLLNSIWFPVKNILVPLVLRRRNVLSQSEDLS